MGEEDLGAYLAVGDEADSLAFQRRKTGRKLPARRCLLAAWGRGHGTSSATSDVFDERLTEGLIEQYLGAVRPEMVARVIVNRALADIKWAFWAVVNRKLKDWDFDYQKYGEWKYMRARDVMYDPRWETWLRMI